MPPTEEDIAWFKSTFHSIPRPQLPDDCVEYSLYAFSPSWLSEDTIRNQLRDVQKAAAQLQKQYLKDYIWQRQGFALELVKEDGVSLLRGRTEYGDSVEDEWVIVWLLRELTKQFKYLYVKVVDNDGEFLLIEAAGTLPEWLEPDVAENRIWIHDGHLIIIKPEQTTKSKKSTSEKLDLQTARQILLNDSKRLLISPGIEEEAFYRLRNYPEQIEENIHHAMVTIPRKAALLLHQKPSYISPAVEAFYLRDPISLKPLQTTAPADLIFPPTDLVTISIAIPRVSYAQLKSQEFPPPKSWEKYMPLKSNEKIFSRVETGMKISCGLEILLSDSHYQDKPAVREMKMILDDVETGDETLPSDADIASWDKREDDEKWLDISFEDLEGELGRGSGDPTRKTGEFGDKATQENLQRIVAQFEKFLNDDAAGPDGAGLFNESDTDEELNSDDDITDDEEDRDISFNDEQLSQMMREMMGLPPDGSAQLRNAKSIRTPGKIEELDSDEEEPTAEDIEKLSRQMEAELNGSGALNLDPTPRKVSATKRITGKGKGKAKAEDDDVHDDGDEMPDLEDPEQDININLAKNLLESLKSQAGMAGPGGNMMGMMGLSMPRDEGDYRTGRFKDDK